MEWAALYLLPARVALWRSHRHRWSILVLNLFGWMVLGWIVALVWAVSNSARRTAMWSVILLLCIVALLFAMNVEWPD
jgi:hypothetical protein